jgi:hypothetical protein
MPTNINRARQTGSALTAWTFGTTGKILALCQEVAHRSPQPVTSAVEVHPLNYVRPTEIIVPRAITHGEIVLTVLETYDKNIWGTIKDVIPGLPDGTNDLADLFTYMMTSDSVNNTSTNESTLLLQRIIRDPRSSSWRKKIFNNARIVDVRDEEDVRVDTIVNPLTITVWYTNLTEASPTDATTNVINSPVSNTSPEWG